MNKLQNAPDGRLSRSVLRIAMAAILAVGFLGCASSHVATSPVAAPAQISLKASPSLSAWLNPLNVCSFNIQFLGASDRRDNAALAELIAPYDIVVVQELIAAPALSASDKPASRQVAARFFREMESRGFEFVMSERDTGRAGDENVPNYGTATEWWVAFYKPAKVRPVADIPHGFISSPLRANADYDRVPYAFAFRTADGRCDFVLVSVHLNPSDAVRRGHELRAVEQWAVERRGHQPERDFIILGDTNVQNRAELRADLSPGFMSLNDACAPTNVSPKGPKPFDQVLFDPSYTIEIDQGYGFHVVNLIEEMRPKWHGPGAYPGDPFQQNVFRFYYSDHNPVCFRLLIPDRDDD